MIYGYIRVSTDKQTVENQRFEIEQFCKKEGIVIDDWIEETISGTKDYRKRKLGPLLQRLHKDDLIICAELSRLGRNLLVIMEILSGLMQKDVKLWTIKDNFRLGDDIQSKVLAFAFGLSAEIERNLISQRTKEALARKKAEGVILGRPKGSKSKTYKLDEHREHVLELLESGISYSGIGRIIGAHRLTVAEYIQNMMDDKMNAGQYSDRENRGKLTLENIQRLREKKMTTKQIANYYGISPSTLLKEINRLKLA